MSEAGSEDGDEVASSEASSEAGTGSSYSGSETGSSSGGSSDDEEEEEEQEEEDDFRELLINVFPTEGDDSGASYFRGEDLHLRDEGNTGLTALARMISKYRWNNQCVVRSKS